MITSIDKALAGLILAFLAQLLGITPEMTVAELVETFTAEGWAMLGKAGIFGTAVWAMPNREKPVVEDLLPLKPLVHSEETEGLSTTEKQVAQLRGELQGLRQSLGLASAAVSEAGARRAPEAPAGAVAKAPPRGAPPSTPPAGGTGGKPSNE